MEKEINLMAKYPVAKRDVGARANIKTEEDREVARRFDKEFFDGDRRYGYGGYNYHPRFWSDAINDFQNHYNLDSNSRVLDVGCGKGFMLYDLTRIIPGINVQGIDISPYAIGNGKSEVLDYLDVANAEELPFEDNSFDLVVSITTVHNLSRNGCKKALSEIERVSRKDKFITVDAYRNEEEKKRMSMWNLTALTYMHVDEWKSFFDEAGYTGDYYWFIP